MSMLTSPAPTFAVLLGACDRRVGNGGDRGGGGTGVCTCQEDNDWF